MRFLLCLQSLGYYVWGTKRFLLLYIELILLINHIVIMFLVTCVWADSLKCFLNCCCFFVYPCLIFIDRDLTWLLLNATYETRKLLSPLQFVKTFFQISQHYKKWSCRFFLHLCQCNNTALNPVVKPGPPFKWKALTSFLKYSTISIWHYRSDILKGNHFKLVQVIGFNHPWGIKSRWIFTCDPFKLREVFLND